MSSEKVKIELTPYHLLRLCMVKQFVFDAISDPLQGVSEFQIKATKEAFETIEKQFFEKVSHEQIDDAIAENEVKKLIS